MLRELKRRADAATPGRVLLILDNVDRPKLLEPAQTARLPQADWLHLIATTRLGEHELFGKQTDRAFLAVDELPEDDALALIESYQPGGKFRDAAERGAAEEIVRLLGRFTLAVEAAAVFLGQFADDVTCAGFRDRLKKQGLTGLEGAASATSEGVRHGEKSLSATLAPTLERLGEPERLALAYAALLPPDHVPLPWLRALMAERFPELGRDAEPGYPDPWQTLARRLLSLRLLQATGVRGPDGGPLVARMHRLVQELVRQGEDAGADELEPAVLAYIKGRSKFLWDGWVAHEHRWELGPLEACAWQWLERDSTDGAYLANQVAGPLRHLGKFAEAEPLLRRALTIDERSWGPDHPDVARASTTWRRCSRPRTGRGRPSRCSPRWRSPSGAWARTTPTSPRPQQPGVVAPGHEPAGGGRAALPPRAGDRRAEPRPGPSRRRHGPQQPGGVALGHEPAGGGRAALPPGAGDLGSGASARTTRRRHGPQQPGGVASGHEPAEGGRAALSPGTGDRRAELGPGPSQRRHGAQQPGGVAPGHEPSGGGRAAPPPRLAIDERSWGPDHPNVAIDLNSLAGLLRTTNRPAEAEPLYRRALAIDERSLGPDHPNVASRLNNLAALLQDTNRPAEAEPLCRRALAIDERSLGPDHPDVARALTNLAALLQDHEPAGGGRAALPPGTGDRRAKFGSGPSRRRPGPQQPGGVAPGHEPSGGGRATPSSGAGDRRAELGPGPPERRHGLNNLALVLRATNRPGEAEPLFRRRLEIDERSLGQDHPNVAIRLNNLAALLRATSRLVEAEPLVRRRWRSGSGASARTIPTSPLALNNLAELLRATNRPGGGRAALPPRPGDRRAKFGPGPSRRRHPPQQPGGVAPGHEPSGGGRAAESAFSGNPPQVHPRPATSIPTCAA